MVMIWNRLHGEKEGGLQLCCRWWSSHRILRSLRLKGLSVDTAAGMGVVPAGRGIQRPGMVVKTFEEKGEESRWRRGRWGP